MNEQELLEKAKRDYPKGTKFKSCTTSIEESTGFFVYKTGYPCVVNMLINGGWDKGGKEITVCDANKNWWAEVVERPSSEPKAGEMVEVKEHDDCEYTYELWKYHGIKNKDGQFICELHDGFVCSWQYIRLPQKSEVESKARELMGYNGWSTDSDAYNDTLKMLISICEWGQQNPDKK